MRLSPVESELVRESFAALSADSDRISVQFYEDMFIRHPRVRAMFSTDTRKQGMRFMQAIGFIVENLEDPAALKANAAKLAHQHSRLVIGGTEYDGMLESLIDTFRRASGLHFSGATEAAWRKAFSMVAGAMMDAQASAAVADSVVPPSSDTAGTALSPD